MRSPPTSPRRRGSLQPNRNWLTVDAQRAWAAGPLPGRTRRLYRGITCGSRLSDSQAFVLVDGSISIGLALVGTPVVCPGPAPPGKSLIQGDIPELNGPTVLSHNGKSHNPESIKASNDQGKQRAAQPRLPDLGGASGPLTQAALFSRTSRSILWACRHSWRA